jgi:hypothetical protein
LPQHTQGEECPLFGHEPLAKYLTDRAPYEGEALSHVRDRVTSLGGERRIVGCGVVRLKAPETWRAGLSAITLTAKCEFPTFKIDTISCPARLEESLSLMGVAVDGEDRMGALFRDDPPILWMLRGVRLDTPGAVKGATLAVTLKVLGLCHPEVALTGRIVLP